jgi:hypothetical protein
LAVLPGNHGNFRVREKHPAFESLGNEHFPGILIEHEQTSLKRFHQRLEGVCPAALYGF